VVATTTIVTAPTATIAVIVIAVVWPGRYYHCRTWVIIIRTSIVRASRRIIAIPGVIIAGTNRGGAATQEHQTNAQRKNQ
jgi:hypothetical protein